VCLAYIGVGIGIILWVYATARGQEIVAVTPGGVFSRPRFAFNSAAAKRYYNILLLLYAETFIITNVDIVIILS